MVPAAEKLTGKWVTLSQLMIYPSHKKWWTVPSVYKIRISIFPSLQVPPGPNHLREKLDPAQARYVCFDADAVIHT